MKCKICLDIGCKYCKSTQSGFTLVEIMIAVGLLAGLAISVMTIFSEVKTTKPTVIKTYTNCSCEE